MTNRLADSASTYLLQHADNPVDWWPWGTPAFDEARRRDVPVLLSIGYASCHWCHVMARESFTDPEVAAQINRGFVAVKVDREERPDVDAVYMTATQALTGGGGWPMTCFLTPDGQPFYAGTYFPPRPSSGLPSFSQLLTAIGDAWAENRPEVLGSAGRIRNALRDMSSPIKGGTLGSAELAAAVAALVDQADPVDGGFGGAPKFPPAMTVEFLLRHHERTGSQPALEVASLTLDRMAGGGIHDQLAGGFARYSVDKRWHVPHFEKMLEDNALLLGTYAHHARLTGSASSAETAAGTAGFVLDELLGDDGLFTASLDAEAAGTEGSTYLWTFAELVEVLGVDDASEAGRVYGLHDGPGDQVLRRVAEPADPRQLDGIRQRLLDRRSTRPQPGRDDIAVTRSNGLMIAALADAGATMGRPAWVTAAGRTADRLLAFHQNSGRWQHSSRRGRLGSGAATLADHADLAAGLLALHQATGDPGRLAAAVAMVEVAAREFAAGSGGFYDTSGDDLIVRPRDPTDGAAPSGASSMADALLGAASLTGSSQLRAAAEAAVSSAGDLAARFPRSAGRHLSVAEALVGGPLQIAISGPPGPDRDLLVVTARRHAPGGSVFAVGEPDRPGVPLLADRPSIGGRPAAYVCRGFVCDRPVTDADALAALLASRS